MTKPGGLLLLCLLHRSISVPVGTFSVILVLVPTAVPEPVPVEFALLTWAGAAVVAATSVRIWTLASEASSATSAVVSARALSKLWKIAAIVPLVAAMLGWLTVSYYGGILNVRHEKWWIVSSLGVMSFTLRLGGWSWQFAADRNFGRTGNRGSRVINDPSPYA